jgi:hypothetical protein
MKFPEIEILENDTPEKVRAYDRAAYVLDMKTKNPASKLWRMRVRLALKLLEELHYASSDRRTES